RHAVLCPPAVPCLVTDTAPTEIYTLSLHDALPILHVLMASWIRKSLTVQLSNNQLKHNSKMPRKHMCASSAFFIFRVAVHKFPRSEEHTSELQSRENLVCRLLLEKKK